MHGLSALRRCGAELLHAHFVRRFGWQAALSGIRPLVVSPWGSDLLRVRRRSVRTRWWNRFALRSADLVTVSSEGMRAAAIRAGARPERVELVHHGVDTARFAPAPGRQGPARLLSIRAIAPLYHHEVVIEAIARLAADGLRPELVLTRMGNAEQLDQLEALARERGVGAQLRILDRVEHDGITVGTAAVFDRVGPLGTAVVTSLANTRRAVDFEGVACTDDGERRTTRV